MSDVTEHTPKSHIVTDEENSRIERFGAAFNEIESFIKENLNLDSEDSFRKVTRAYKSHFPSWQDKPRVDMFSELRNVLVHDHVRPRAYICVPLPYIVEEIEAIRDRLVHSPKAIDLLKNKVALLKPTDSLDEALRLMHTNQYSQIPIYTPPEFKGMLTENGISRWLASHVAKGESLIEFEDEKIQVVLKAEEARRNCIFAPRAINTNQVVDAFMQNVELEAIIITASGKKNETPLRIATAWDAIKFSKQKASTFAA